MPPTPTVGAYDPAVATPPRRQGRRRRGACPAHQSVRPRRPYRICRRPGTHRAGEPDCPGASEDRCRPAVCPARTRRTNLGGHTLRAHNPAVAYRLRRTGPATPGCVPGAPIYPAGAASGESVRGPGTQRAGEPDCLGAAGDRRRPAVCPRVVGPPVSAATRVRAHDPAVAYRLRRTGPATPGCVPGAPIYPAGAASGASIRRPGTQRASEAASAGASEDRRRPAVCPYAFVGPPVSAATVRAHNPAVAYRLRRTGPATPGCVPGAPICPAGAASGESVRRPGTHRAGEAAVPAQLGIAAGPPCAPTRRRPTGLGGQARRAYDPAVAYRLRRTGRATPGCVPGAPINPAGAASGESVRRPGTQRAGEAAGAAQWGSPPARRVPLRVSAHRSIRPRRH